MIIKNFQELVTSGGRKDALHIIESGLRIALPEVPLRKIVKQNKLLIGKKTYLLSEYSNVFIIGFGKAAYSMARTICELTRIDGGIIVIPKEQKSVLKNKKIKILYAGHPIPDKQSVIAGKKIIEFLQNKTASDFVIFLISGGGSSLVSLPADISLQDKKTVTDLLLKSGANIKEINCVRKHLSQIKGGRLTENLSCDAVSLVMSDVVGNDLSDIASAPTYFDKTTFKDTDKILTKYNLKKVTPKPIINRISLGIRGEISETPKSSKIKNYIISTNNDCLKVMGQKARKLGYVVKIMPCLSGRVQDISKKLVKSFSMNPNSCLIFGGETTVKVIGNGKGGRNQELVLYILKQIQKCTENVVIASCGTDGKDGNTDASGAIIETSIKQFPNIEKFLKINNSYYFFKRQHCLIFTGPTHTNLMDVGILLTR